MLSDEIKKLRQNVPAFLFLLCIYRYSALTLTERVHYIRLLQFNTFLILC